MKHWFLTGAQFIILQNLFWYSLLYQKRFETLNLISCYFFFLEKDVPRYTHVTFLTWDLYCTSTFHLLRGTRQSKINNCPCKTDFFFYGNIKAVLQYRIFIQHYHLVYIYFNCSPWPFLTILNAEKVKVTVLCQLTFFSKKMQLGLFGYERSRLL